MKYLNILLALVLSIGNYTYARTPVPKDISFNVTVVDSTNKRELHNQRFTFTNDGDGSRQVKLIYEIGEFVSGGLQFVLMLYSDNSYEAYITPVPDGKDISSGITVSKKIRIEKNWNNTTYAFMIEPL